LKPDIEADLRRPSLLLSFVPNDLYIESTAEQQPMDNDFGFEDAPIEPIKRLNTLFVEEQFD